MPDSQIPAVDRAGPPGGALTVAPCGFRAKFVRLCGRAGLASSLACLPLVSLGCGSKSLQPAWAKSKLGMEDISIADVQGPEQRRLQTVAHEQMVSDGAGYEGTPLADGFRKLEAAQQLYNQGRYAESEKAFDTIAKETQGPWWNRSTKGIFARRGDDLSSLSDSPVEEDALFMKAQSQFMQGHLAVADRSYAELLRKFPSTRHLDTVSKQLFRISREWLGFPDADDKQLVAAIYGDKAAPTMEQRRQSRGGWLPNLRDKSRPSFDADGRALAALRLIWLHDASGPLADDALMMAANHYVRQGNHVDAAQHYRLLREQFPDSPHMKEALLLGSHVILASYNGPGYDPSPLEEAKELKLLALQFPGMPEEDRQRLQGELERLKEAEVEPLWKEVEFYLRKRQPESVLLQCNYIINKHPNSRYARMAAELKQRMEADGRLPPHWPYVAPQGQAAAPSATGSSSRSMMNRLLRRADEAPQLQPVEPGPASNAADVTESNPGRASID